MTFKQDMDDIMTDPAKYGAPTFEEFKRNRKKYIRSKEHAFEVVDQSTNVLGVRQLIERQKYFFIAGNGKKYPCKSLEEVWNVAQAEGVDTSKIEYEPHTIPMGNGRCEMHVFFYGPQAGVVA